MDTTQIRFDATYLADAGLGDLPADAGNSLLETLYRELEQRVGMSVAESLTDAQFDEFETFVDSSDEAGALSWLQENAPHYKDVVRQEFRLLTSELRARAHEIRSRLGLPIS